MIFPNRKSRYYRPITNHLRKLPILVWIHGGSGISGSSTAAGLDGTQLAAENGAIVVLLQYRLGLFGWLQSSSTIDEEQGGEPGSGLVAGNQALRDVQLALEQVRVLADSLGGDHSKITLIGQSSGATMVRALLTTPSAQDLFNNAVLVSDPQDYDLSSKQDNNDLGQYGLSLLNCSIDAIHCARNKTASQILTATTEAYVQVPPQNARISPGTPWRPMVGKLVTSTIADGTVSKDVIMTTVAQEAGTLAAYLYNFTPAGATEMKQTYSNNSVTFCSAVSAVFGAKRSPQLCQDASLYSVNERQPDALRSTFQRIATDGLWRCAVQRNGVKYVE